MNISFGKKIPIAQCQILNRRSNQFEPATIYELDCKDRSDIDEIPKDSPNWQYALFLRENMYRKYALQRYYEQDNNTSFYILQNKNNKTYGMAQVEEFQPKTYNLEYVDTKSQKPYKYVGQTLLAGIAKEIQKKGGTKFTVNDATDVAYPFYEKVCGFPCLGGYYLCMLQEDMEEFISRTEEKTQSKLIDLSV